MLGRTQKKVEHGREREVGGWEKANKKRRIGESTYIDGMRPNFLLIFACLTASDIVGQCAHVSF